METAKANMIRKLEDQAALSYDKIITRYPAGGRSEDAIAKLKSMNRPVPTASQEAIAQSKAEEASRGESTRVQSIMGNFRKGPDMAHAAKVGEPTLEDAKPTNAPDVLKATVQMALEAGTEASKTTVETVKPGTTGTAGAPQSDKAAPKTEDGAAEKNTDVNTATATVKKTTNR